MAWIRFFPNSYFGITSAITHEEEEEVREVAICAPLHRHVTETDAPYFLPKLAPSSHRYSDPLMVLLGAKSIAEIKGIPLWDVLQQIHKNIWNLYGV